MERNPIISLAGCHVGAAVTRQVFSFITYESEAFFLPVRPWDQTGFHQTKCGNRIHADPEIFKFGEKHVFFFGSERSIFSDRFVERESIFNPTN